ncbi:MAG: alkaline phosphatase [Mariniblastus sp.]|nr:alkaline phosphatase [Mariniblastus sp.]
MRMVRSLVDGSSLNETSNISLFFKTKRAVPRRSFILEIDWRLGSTTGIKIIVLLAVLLAAPLGGQPSLFSQERLGNRKEEDYVRRLQLQATESNFAEWAHWGKKPKSYGDWTSHSNRLIPVFSFGMKLDSWQGENSLYRDASRIEALYGFLPKKTLNPKADYFDQTDLYHLQQQAFAAGKRHIVIFVFDGMDWPTIQAAAVYKRKKVTYTKGAGTGLAFQDYRVASHDFGWFVTSPHSGDANSDVDAQTVVCSDNTAGGYSAAYGGSNPWQKSVSASYLLGKYKALPHVVTDSAASATSLFSGIKTFNGSVNIGVDGRQVIPIARQVQGQGFSVGVVSSVQLSHATCACAYANNVSRDDYQDLTRDMVGLKSIAHKEEPLLGLDVLIGGGWGENANDDRVNQGANYVPGNKVIASNDLKSIDVEHGGRYVVASRTEGEDGSQVLAAAARRAAQDGKRLFGLFGVKRGHLPFRTADGGFDPTRGTNHQDRYKPEDIEENPTLAEMTRASLEVLQTNKKGFWLLVEAGDVDWANHKNNIDDSIGAVLSGEAAFQVVVDWVSQESNWDETAVIVTADHGHYLVLNDPQVLTGSQGPDEFNSGD